MDNIIGERLKELRIGQQLTMEMMAEDYNAKFNENLNTSQISRWETGKTDPGLSTGAQLAKYFNVSLDYIIGLTDVKTPSRLLAYASKIAKQKTDSFKAPKTLYHVSFENDQCKITPIEKKEVHNED